jgi:glycosyltransferase involved in cell wall biosynthesis
LIGIYSALFFESNCFALNGFALYNYWHKDRSVMNKICMVVHQNYYGDGRVRRYAESLAEAGAQVDILCVRNDKVTSGESQRGIRVMTIPVGRGYKNRLSYLFEYALAFMLFAFYLLVLHLRNRYDVIHVHNMPDFLLFVALIPKWLGAKLILDIHDPMPEFYMSKYGTPRDTLGVRLLRLQERWATRMAHEVITANQYFRENLIQRGIPADKITVVNNIPDEKIFHRNGYQRDFQNKRQHFTLIYPGTIAPRYHLDVAIRALPRIIPSVPNVRLKIIGPLVDYVEELKYLTRQLGVQGFVEFHPAIRINEVPQQLMQADLGIYLALPDAHMNIATPSKVLEFAAMGLPIIASRLKVLETFFTDSALHFLNPGDVEAFAEAVVALHRSPEKREDMVRHADAAFVNTYSWQNEMQKYFVLQDRLKFITEK